MIELIADQGVAICQAHCASWQRCWIAARTIVGEVLPERVAGYIGFNNAAVVGIRDEGRAVGKAGGKSHAAEGHGASASERGENRAWHGMRDLESLVVVLVGDEDVAGRSEQLGGVGIIQPIVFPHDCLIRAAHLDDAAIALVRDQDVVVSVRLMQIGVLYRGIKLVEPGPRNAELPVLPDDVAARIHEEHTVIHTALFAMRGADGASGNAGPGHQGEVVHALGVVGADEGTRGEVAWTASELPDDIATGVDLDDSIVELICDESGAWPFE